MPDDETPEALRAENYRLRQRIAGLEGDARKLTEQMEMWRRQAEWCWEHRDTFS